MIKRTTSEIVMLCISALAIISITPFAILRLVEHDWIMAIVDTLIVTGLVAFFIYVYTTRKVQAANLVMALFAATAIISSTYLKGTSQVYWMYPAMVAAYYLMPPISAIVITSISIAMLAVILYPETEIMSFVSIFATVILTTFFAFIFSHSAHEKHKQLTLLATIDTLTSTGNRRALDKKLARVIQSQLRKKVPMSLILLDLDHFKKVNDEYGHAMGDDVLIDVSELIRSHTRISDSLYRYGGEEFIIVPLYENIQRAKILAEKLRSVVEASDFLPDKSVTISLGVAQYKQGETAEHWISRADTALYAAKKSGRNQVQLAR